MGAAKMVARVRSAMVVGAVLALWASGSPPVAFAAQPASFASISATCDHNDNYGQQFTGAPVASAHPNVLYRYTVASGGALFYSGPVQVDVGDVIWLRGLSVGANQAPGVNVSCGYSNSADVPFTADFVDSPTTPTAFSGAGNLDGSGLSFIAPAAAQYVADVTLNGGAVKLSSGNSQTFASSGQFPLGILKSGVQSLDVKALDGPRPQWTIAIRALPVAISGLTFSAPATRPGALVQATYTVSGDTSITATVRDALGQPVKTLASGITVTAGDHSLAWDARDDGGLLLPDGTYTLDLRSTDPTGQVAAASASITVDGAPPMITMTTPSTLTPGQAVSGRLSDALTGIADLDVTDPEQYTTATPAIFAPQAGKATFTVAPRQGDWDLGAHTLKITATDGVGNVKVINHKFKVATSGSRSRVVRPCGFMRVGTTKLYATTAKRITCRSARALLRDAVRGRGRYHAGRSNADSYTVIRRFRCKVHTGLASCWRGRLAATGRMYRLHASGASAATSARTVTRKCGAVLGQGTPYAIVSRNVKCGAAKNLAKQASKVPSYGGCGVSNEAGTRVVLRQPCRIGGFRCKTIAAADKYHSRNECTASGSRRVRYTQG